MYDNPLIFSGCAAKRTNSKPGRSKYKPSTPQLEVTEQKGDLLIRDLWQNGNDSVHDMRAVKHAAKSHLAKTPEQCLQEAEGAKKNMYLEACIHQRQHFSPFVVSFDGLLGLEASATLKMIASRLTTKWWHPYSRTCGYVKSRISITLVRATQRCIRGYRVPAHNTRVQQPQWKDGSGINLFR